MKIVSPANQKYYLLVSMLGTIASLISIYYFFDFVKTKTILEIIVSTLFTLWLSGYTIYFWMRYKNERLEKSQQRARAK